MAQFCDKCGEEIMSVCPHCGVKTKLTSWQEDSAQAEKPDNACRCCGVLIASPLTHCERCNRKLNPIPPYEPDFVEGAMAMLFLVKKELQ